MFSYILKATGRIALTGDERHAPGALTDRFHSVGGCRLPRSQNARYSPKGDVVEGVDMGEHRDDIFVVTPADRTPGPATPGMDRQQAVATDGTWSGFVSTEPGTVSGWHHHGEYETVIYVLTGALRMEFGSNGTDTAEAGPGDFVYVPKRAVHRESNPATVPADIIVVRAGEGESTFNVESPGQT